MPEIKRLFNASRMNRDLDDKMLKPGEYREALNINVSKSESSDIGAVENILGNKLKDNNEKSQDISAFSAGIYFVKVSQLETDHQQLIKVVKK